MKGQHLLHPKSFPEPYGYPSLHQLKDKIVNALSAHKHLRRKEGCVKVQNGDPVVGKHISEMPGSKALPFIKCIFSVKLRKDFNPLKLHTTMLNIVKEYGPLTHHKFPFLPPMVLVTNIEDIVKMYNLTMDNPIRCGVHSLKKVRDETANNYFEGNCGLLVENEEKWLNVRNKVQTLLLRPQNIAKYLPAIEEVTMNFIDRISELQATYGEMPQNFVDELSKWSLETIALVTLNKRLGCLDPNIEEDSELMKLIKNVGLFFQSMNETELSLPIWRIFPTPVYKKMRDAHEYVVRVFDKHICESESALLSKLPNEKDSCLMESLLKIDGLSRKDALITVLDMLMAGVDTTSSVVGFTLYCLARNPRAQERLHEELDVVLGDGKPLTEKHLARLSFTKACVKEASRLYPIVLGHCRKLSADAEFGGYVVPKGHQVVAFTYHASKDESLFPRAKEYLPERWGRDRPLGPIHPYALLPFSYGPRMCVGRRIAEHEMYTFIARVMHRFNIDYKYQDMDTETKFLILPATPLRFEFKERR